MRISSTVHFLFISGPQIAHMNKAFCLQCLYLSNCHAPFLNIIGAFLFYGFDIQVPPRIIRIRGTDLTDRRPWPSTEGLVPFVLFLSLFSQQQRVSRKSGEHIATERLAGRARAKCTVTSPPRPLYGRSLSRGEENVLAGH